MGKAEVEASSVLELRSSEGAGERRKYSLERESVPAASKRRRPDEVLT